MKRQTGIYEKLGELNYFIPDPLPPQNPSFETAGELAIQYGASMHRLAQLNEMALRVPNAQRFIKAYVIKEALLSSAIEGIHTTLIEAFTQPVSLTKPNKETQLVLNYTQALDIALNLMQKENLPIGNRIILSSHEKLMREGQGDHASPGQFRKQSVRVGNLIPPPATRVPQLMAELERFINVDESIPPLIKAGLAHVQFETIHPFLDGNGRIGRLLIVLMLIDSNLLSSPILYPSYYFKKNQFEYYRRLDSVRIEGDFEGWIHYYLKAIEESSFDAYQRALDIESLEQKFKQEVETNERFARVHEHAKTALNILFQFPIINIQTLADNIGKSYNTARNIIELFIETGILVEESQQKRNKLYYFKQYIELLEKEYSL